MRRPRPRAWFFPAGVTALVPAPALGAVLNLNPDPTIVAANVVLFLALIYPVNRWLLRPMVDLIRERERRSSGTADEASSTRGDIQRLRVELEQGLHSARERAAGGRNEIAAAGQQQEREVLARAREEAVRTVDAVREGVSRELETARSALREEAGALAREAAAKILGRSL